jgi:hypothetical protein
MSKSAVLAHSLEVRMVRSEFEASTYLYFVAFARLAAHTS